MTVSASNIIAAAIADHELTADVDTTVIVSEHEIESSHPVAIPAGAASLASVVDYYAGMGITVAIAESSVYESLRSAKQLGCSVAIEGEIRELPAGNDYRLALYRHAPAEHRDRERMACAFALVSQIPTDLTEQEAAELLLANSNGRTDAELCEMAIEHACAAHHDRIIAQTRVDADIDRQTVEQLDEEVVDQILAAEGVTLLKTPMGSGKSSKVVEPLMIKAAQAGLRPHLISPLISIAEGVRERVQVALGDRISFYSDVKPADASSAPALVSVVNSVNKSCVKAISHSADVLILEEGEKIIAGIATSDQLKDKKQVWGELQQLIKTARHVVIADADISDVTVNFVRELRQDVKLIEMPAAQNGVTVELWDANELSAHARDAYQKQKNLVVLSDSRRQLERRLRAIGCDKADDTLFIHGSNSGTRKSQAFLKNPNAESHSTRVLAYTPALASSVSITSEHYDEVIAFASGVLSAIEFVQMLRRYRPATRIRLAITADVHIKNPQNIKSQLEKSFGKLDQIDRAMAEIITGKKYSAESIYSSLPITLRHLGFTIARAGRDEERREIGRVATSKAKKQLAEEHIERVMNAREIGGERAREYERSSMLDQHDEAALERFQIRTNLGEVDEKAVKWWNRGAGFKKLRLLNTVKMSEKDAEHATRHQKDAAHDRIDYVATRELLNGALDLLGVSIENGGRFTRFDAQAAATYLQQNADRWNALGITKTVNPRSDMTRGQTAVRLISDLMAQLGISVSQKTARVAGGRTTSYTVTNAQQLADYL